MLWRGSDIARATGLEANPDWRAQGLTGDLAALRRGMIFVAPGGQGGAEALAAGAALVLTDAPAGLPASRVLACPDLDAALAGLAASARRRSRAQIVAIAGGLGKSTLAGMLRAGLAGQGESSFAAADGPRGLSIAMAGLPPKGVAILELQARAPGLLGPMIKALRPGHLGLVPTAPRHLEAFGSTSAMAKDMGEAIAAMPRGARLALPCDDPGWSLWRRRVKRSHHVLTYGAGPAAHHRASQIHLSDRITTARARGWRTPIMLRLAGHGAHLPVLALGALVLARGLGADGARALCGFAQWRPGPGMGGIRALALDPILEEQWISLRDSARHADPRSLGAGLGWLTREGPQTARRLAILAAPPHQGAAIAEEIARAAASGPPLQLLLIGPEIAAEASRLAPHCAPAFLPTAAALLPRLKRLFHAGDRVLIQGPPDARLYLAVDAMGKLGHRRGSL